MAVSKIFDEAGISVDNIQLGRVKTSTTIDAEKLQQINTELKKIGFEIIHDSKRRIIEQIKTILINYVYQHKGGNETNISHYLVDKVNLDYPYLSSLFSSVEGITIEKYLIHLKIERVKELLVYDEKNLSEIAWELGYSSVAHLSGQFKKITGFTPSYFKELRKQKRKSINDIGS